MPKILSRSGASLADIYDVEGSIAGIETLESTDVSLVHDLGQAIANERLGGTILQIGTGAILQDITWDLLLPSLPASTNASVSRILGISVIATQDRVDRATVSIHGPGAVGAGLEIPIFVWNTANDGSIVVRWLNSGTLNDAATYLRPAVPIPGMPSLLFGPAQPQIMPAISFRGLTTGFGAGTVTVTCQVYMSWIELAGVRSFGLPIPGW